MLTTADEDFCAAKRKLPAGTAAGLPAGASMTATVPPARSTPPSQPGFKVASTKYAANKTVTDWENSNQKRFMRKARIWLGEVIEATTGVKL